MINAIGIVKKVEGLLDEMYELGREEGYEEGWNEAKTHFRVPDL
jgi:flagellar biosynthesis/type III secretory pathway protein FliH